MRVALLDPPSFTPPYDHALASALSRRGHDVHLLASPAPLWPGYEPNGYRRLEVFTPRSARLSAPRRARTVLRALEYVPSARHALRRLDELAPDLVHVQWLGAAPYDIRWLRRLERELPTVLTAHDLRPRRAWNARGWAEAFSLVDRVIVHSERAVDELAARGVRRRRLARIDHPVFDGPPGFEPSEPAGRTLLFFGLIRQYKGLDLLIRALPEIADARLVVAGPAFDPVEPLQRLADELGVAGRIEWRLGFVPPEEVPALVEEAAVLVLPYRELESSGVLATGLGHGRPAVVADVGSLSAIVREFEAGRVVPPEDPPALAAACAELLSEPEALARAARGARKARATLTWDAAAAEHERLYEEVLAERA
jgi:glycosyltransferase involved in cell wall biosynthesis